MNDPRLDELLREARTWLRMAGDTLKKQSRHQLAHRDMLVASLLMLKEWQQAENRAADKANRGEK